jgi:RimJ/RimL family protein N-acetyltransferase
VAELVTPCAGLRSSFLAALLEYHEDGMHLELDETALAAPGEFARYVAALIADVETPGEPDRHAARLRGEGEPKPREGGYVPQTILWWVEGDEYLGRVGIRHRLTEQLARRGGHIGYEVRPGARRRGHATAMLAAALPIAHALGIHEALVDCDAANVASRRVVEKNGGRLLGEGEGELYFIVPTRRGA